MFRRNYTNHIAMSILICVAIPAIILFGILQFDQNAFTEYHVSQVATSQLQNKITDLQGWLNDQSSAVAQYGSAMESYSKSYGIDANTPDFLTMLAEANRDITYLYVTTEDGIQHVSGGAYPLLDGRTRPWYIGAVKQDVYISAPYEDILTHKLVVTFSKSIRDDNNAIQGVIAMDVLLNDIVSDLENSTSGNLYNIVIQNEDGFLSYVSKPFRNTSILDKLDSTQGLLELKVNGKKFNGIRYDLRNMHSSVYIFLSMESYYEGYSDFNKEYIVNALVIFIALLALLRISSGFLYRPLSRLSAHISESNSNETVANKQNLPADLMKIHEKFVNLKNISEERRLEVLQMNMHVHEHNTEIESVNLELEASYNNLSLLKDELELQEEKYLDLVNNIPDIIWICDANGRLIYGNKPFEVLIDRKLEFSDRLHIADYIDVLSKNNDKFLMFLERDYNNIEIDFLTGSGSVHSMEGSVSRIYESGKLIAVQGIFRDASESRSMYFDYYDRNRELTLVNDITKSLISNVDLELVLNDIAGKVGQIMSISMCTIRLLEDDRFKLVASSGANEQVIYDDAPFIDASHMGWAFKQNKSLIITSEMDFLMEDTELYDAMNVLNSVVYIPLATNDKVYGVMAIGTEFDVKREKVKILETLADQAAIAIERMQIFEKLRSHYFKTIEALVAANDAKVPKMEGHTKRVSDIAIEIGKRLYLRKKDIDDIYIAGLLHDIGKMNIPDALLSKKADLTDEEAKLLDQHPMYSKKILEPIGMSIAIMEGIYYHHKKFDLSGEPHDEEITNLPLIARIIGAVDDLDAMMVGRDGDAPMSLTDAMMCIMNGAGKDYCPEVAKVINEIAVTEPYLIEGHYSIVEFGKEVSI